MKNTGLLPLLPLNNPLNSKRSLSFDESLDIIGAEPEALSRQFHFLQFTPPSHRVNGLHFEAEHGGDIFGGEQSTFLLLFSHGATMKQRLLFCRVN